MGDEVREVSGGQVMQGGPCRSGGSFGVFFTVNGEAGRAYGGDTWSN